MESSTAIGDKNFKKTDGSDEKKNKKAITKKKKSKHEKLPLASVPLKKTTTELPIR